MTRILVAACVLSLAPVLSAQAPLCVTVSPNPAPLGATITVTCHATGSVPLYTQNGCLVQTINQGTPAGPVVKSFFCITIPVAIPPCGTASPRTMTWNQQNGSLAQVPPGLYWFRIDQGQSGFGGFITEWHSVTITGATPTPVLAATGPANWNSPFSLTINAPSLPNSFYAIALSGSTNTGLALAPGLFVALDQDAIFNLTWPTPNPSFFLNFQGFLDAGGVGGGTIFLPAFSGCFPLHAQAGLIDAIGNVYLTNELAFTIT